MVIDAALMHSTTLATDEPFFSVILDAVANAQSLVYARFDSNGKRLFNNRGLESLLHDGLDEHTGEAPIDLQDVMVIPVFESLESTASSKTPAMVYEGQITLRSFNGHLHSLSGKLYRHDDELWLLAEYNLHDMLHYRTVLEALQDELAQAHRTLMCKHDESLCDEPGSKAGDWVRVDSLTGLGNAVAFEGKLATEYRRMRAYEQPLSLCLLDIDELSVIQRQQGHEASDTVVCKIADVLQHSLRATDSVFRLDYSRFAIIIGQLESGQTAQIAERLARTLGRMTIEDVVAGVDARFAVVSSEGSESLNAMLSRALKILD